MVYRSKLINRIIAGAIALIFIFLSCSDEKTIQVDYVRPDVILDLAIDSTADGSISLSWTAPADNQNADIASYEIRYSYNNNDSVEDWLVYQSDIRPSKTGQPENIILNNLHQGPRCYIRICSIDKSGNKSEWSNTVSDYAVYNTTVSFVDSELEATVRYAIDKPEGELYYKELLEIAKISKYGSNISNLSGIEYLKNIENIYLPISKISNLNSLSELKYLSYLVLTRAQISDLLPIANLPNIECIALAQNQLSDISVLANFENLRLLDVSYNQVTDISCLENLKMLEYLHLDCNDIDNFDIISGFPNLNDLSLYNSNVEDISFIENLTCLRNLRLGLNDISDLSPLNGLDKLQYVILYYNDIEDISVLAQHINLHKLYLDANRITDILPLVQNSGLNGGDSVYLYENPLSWQSINEYIPALEERGVVVFY